MKLDYEELERDIPAGLPVNGRLISEQDAIELRLAVIGSKINSIGRTVDPSTRREQLLNSLKSLQPYHGSIIVVPAAEADTDS